VYLGHGRGTIRDVEVQDILQELVKMQLMHPLEKISIGVKKMHRRQHNVPDPQLEPSNDASLAR
jgi:hypothetical protein